MDDDLEGVVSNIRACIVSSKGPVPLRSLMRDYETLVGSQIPYRNFNFSSLESFLQSVPSLRVCGSGRDAMVEAASSSASKHISALISKQKTTKKSNYAPPPRRSYPYSSRGRGRARDYASRPHYSQPPRESQSRSHANSHSYTAPRQYLPNSQPRMDNENGNAHSEPLTIQVDQDDNRHVSIGDIPSPNQPLSSHADTRSRRYEIPPRLQRQRLQQQVTDIPFSPPLPVNEVSPGFQTSLSMNQSNPESESSTIISAMGPSQLVAAGLAKKEAENARYRGYYGSLSDSLLQPAESELLPEASSILPQLQLESAVCVPEPDQIVITNNIKLLMQYSLDRGWSLPEYTLFNRKPNGSHKVLYGASVKINGLGSKQTKFSSYPYEDGTPNVAKGYAAKKALEELLKEQKVMGDKTTISTDKNIICDRISEIVAAAYNGLFAKMVMERYIEKFSEGLPDDWIQMLDSCNTVEVDNTNTSIIITPKTPPPLNLTEPVCSPPSLPIEELKDDTLFVYVTTATSTNNVWFRLIGENYSEQFEELLNKMDVYYNSLGKEEIALTVEEGQYYAARSLDSWFRILVCEVTEESRTVSAWLIDHGDTDLFAFSSIYMLAPEFCTLPRQAIHCSLDGLEDFDNDEIAGKVISTSDFLIGKALIAQIKSREKVSMKVTLYDTSGEDDININEVLRDTITYSKADPALPNEGFARDVYISDVSKKGEVHIQIPNPIFDRITEVLETLGTEEISKHKLTSFRQITLNKKYLAKYSKDDTWYRAVVTATPSVQQNKIAVRFIDFGNAETVGISDIADIEKLPPILNKLPPQALKVALHNLPIETLTNAEVAKLNLLLLDEEKVILIKTIKLKADPPVVEIFYKNEADNGALVSVNSTIEIQRSLNWNNTEDKSNPFNLTNLKSSVNSVSHELNCFVMKPELGHYESVLIALAANPGNFIFQPMKYGEELKSLRERMRKHYEVAISTEVTKEKLVVGSLFAFLDARDNTWYRAVVTDSVIGDRVPIRLCDYGDILCESISSLRILHPEFLQHPFMAVKGKLAGVVPIHKDWTPEDCMYFQELVANKVLAAYVINIQEDLANPLEMVVSLELIDTTSELDLVISDTFINQLRAVKEN